MMERKKRRGSERTIQDRPTKASRRNGRRYQTDTHPHPHPHPNPPFRNPVSRYHKYHQSLGKKEKEKKKEKKNFQSVDPTPLPYLLLPPPFLQRSTPPGFASSTLLHLPT
ncbi:hypothetical protein IE53DRAFT_211151 [Violaceomyces palustris]|uniref:Uncharacterized protein n=1 Tax=Violaceomyces palustris TaxID=1673888 RepID=A0ACD0P4Z7_9BASI|nr:hypothetical protein IE53DRAFT_211151 [Violaceomyces palustris]